MLNNIRLFLPILILLFGCGTIPQTKPIIPAFQYSDKEWYEGKGKIIPIWIDDDFSANDKEVIEDGAAFWNKVLNGYIKILVMDDHFKMSGSSIKTQVENGGWLIMKINHNSFLIPNSGINYKSLGFSDSIGGHHIYLIRDIMNDDSLFGVVLHEMGHLLGSGHIGNGLMSPHFDKIRFRCIDYATVLAVAKYQGLDIEKLNYCEIK